MSYKITSLYKIPHGHAVAVCLPEIWEYMLEHMEECIDSRSVRDCEDIFNNISRSIGGCSSYEAIHIFRKLMFDLELKGPVSSTKKQDVDILSSSVNPIRLKNNPIQNAIKNLYGCIVRLS